MAATHEGPPSSVKDCSPHGVRDTVDVQYEAEAESKVFDPVIEGIARLFGCDAEEVQSLYDSNMTELKRDAIIMDFLPIFALRRIRDLLRLRATPAPA
jgi:hypothetical protein